MEDIGKTLETFVDQQPTFSDAMQKHIEEEKRKMVEEARKWVKSHNPEHENR